MTQGTLSEGNVVALWLSRMVKEGLAEFGTCSFGIDQIIKNAEGVKVLRRIEEGPNNHRRTDSAPTYQGWT